jgi:putative ABC transport system substrate-binding protein
MERRKSRLSRRQFVVGAGASSAALLAGCGRLPWQGPQAPATVPRIGYLASRAIAANPALTEAFLQGLHELGWVEDQNLVIEYRVAGDKPAGYQELATEFVRLPVDLIVATGTPGALAAKQATNTIPIVTVAAGDPVGTGLVASFARPGGNVTGMSQSTPLLSAKRVEFLKETRPGVSTVAVFANLSNPANVREWEETQAAGRLVGMLLQLLDVRDAGALPTAFETARQARAEGLIVFADPLLNGAQAIVDFAAEAGLPAIYGWTEHTGRGGLMAYAPEARELFRRAAYYVDRILRGAKPADLPVEQPMRFDFIVNLKAAQALGITFPNEILLQVTEVIQ